jgi:3-phenylpropionate/trans-cinnamate dioxygenase ferredoxin subunit
MKGYVVCEASEMKPGERKLIDADGKSIGVFNVNGEYYALRNICPHQFAPLCQGKVTGYCAPSEVGTFSWQRDGEIIRCPWHAWEFDIKDGRSIFNPHRVRTKSYDVKVESREEPSVETFAAKVEGDVVVVYA